MGYIADQIAAANARVPAPANDTLGDSLRKGWSSGVDTMGADVNQIVGLGAEAMGADNFAQGRYRAAQGLREDAQRNAPSVHSLDQVDGVGNALRWGVGQIGAMGPTALGVMGGTVATGNPFVGGALAMGLPEAGDIAHRQTLDPTVMEQGAGSRLAQALAGGAASGAVQAAGPAMLLGKAAKGAGAGLVKQSTGQIIGQNFAEGVGMNAAAEGGSEAIKQYAANQDAPFNKGAIGEAALSGAILGVPFGALGAGVDLAKASPGKSWIGAKKAVQEGVKTARGAFDSAGEALTPVGEAAKAVVPEDVVSRLREFSKPAGDMLDTILNSESMADTKEFAGKTLDQAKEMLKGRREQASKWLGPKMDELMDRADVSDERKQQIADLRNNIGDAASQAKAATILKAQSLADAAKPKLDATYEKVGAAYRKLFPEDPNVKKSEDHSGMNALIFDKIGPMIKEARPELLEDADSTMKLGSTLRMFMQAAAEGKDLRVAGIHTEMTDLLGPGLAHDVLNAAHEFATGGDQTKQANYFKHLTESVKEKTSMDGLETVITKNLSNEAPQRTGVTDNPRELAKYLRGWARGDYAAGKPRERVEFEDQEVQKFLETHFGTNAQKIRDALQKDVESNKNTILTGNEDGMSEKEVGGVEYVGGGKRGNTALSKPFVGQNSYGGTSASKRVMEDIESKDRSRKTKFVTVSEDASLFDKIPAFKSFVTKTTKAMQATYPKLLLEAEAALKSHPDNYAQGMTPKKLADGWLREDTHNAIEAKKKDMREKGNGLVQVTGLNDADLLSKEDIDSMRMDAAHSDNKENPSRLVVMGEGGADQVFDATRVTGTQMRRINRERSWTADDDKSELRRIARAFMEGVGSLMEEYGPIEVPDATVVWRKDTKEITFADLKADNKGVKSSKSVDAQGNETWFKRGMSPGEVMEADGADALNELNYLQRLHQNMKDGLEAVQEEIRSLTDSWKESGQKGKPRDLRQAESELASIQRQVEQVEKSIERMDATIERQAGYERFAKSKTEEGKQSADADGNIHHAVAELGGNGVVHRVNMDGTMAGSAIGSKHGKSTWNFVGSASRKRKQEALAAAKEARIPRKAATDRSGAIQENPVRFDQEGRAISAERKTAKPLKARLDEYADYIDNPPDGFSVERAKEIASWAERQEARLKEAKAKLEEKGGDEFERLEGMYFDAQLLKERARAVIKSEEDATDMGLRDGEDTPDPKVVAAKKAAFLERAASGDKALIKELSTSTDAKGLQRAVEALYDVVGADDALQAANKRLSELVQDPDVAYGLQTKKYSLESGSEAIDGRARLITRLADARRSEFAHADEAAVFIRSEGEVSFGPVQGGTKFFFSDSRSSHAYVVAAEHIAAVKYNLNVKPLERHADVLAYFAVQHAFLDRHSGEFQSFASLPSSPTGKWLESKNAVEPTGEFFGDGVTPINRVVGVTARQNSDFLADALAYAKHIEGADRIFVDWTRITGARKGKRGSGMFDATAATNTSPLTAKGRKQILDYLNTATPWVQAEFPFLAHAGEFTKEFGQAIIRVSSHALNPTSVAYHESLHAFFQHLSENSGKDISQVVKDAASSPAVTSQLRRLLSHSPEALKQLSDPEERAAYMYQFWADGKLTLGEKPTTLFGKITAAFRKVLGIWSNDERALQIMEYFHSGEYAQNVGKQSAVRAALMEKGRNTAVDKMQEMGGKFMEVGDALWGAGSARLRDSKSEALHELADLIKRRGTDQGEDRGYIPAARVKRTEFVSRLAEDLEGVDESAMHEALEALQGGTKPTSLEARKAYASVRKVLDDVFDYLHQSGVDTGDLGYGKDYFPRHWDSNYLSKHEAEFMDMARKYPQWADAKDTYNKLVANDGSELRVVDRPGMQANKKRVLSFISDADAAPFMSKNLPEIMNGYITQATRRAEWARRFGDDNAFMGKLLKRAREEGASDEEVAHAQDFVAGVNGTLGDDLNPTLRRYMGNMIVYQNIRLLPLAVFSSVVDPAGVMVRGGTMGDAWATFKRGIREVPAGLKGRQIKDYWTDMAQTLGVIDNAALQHALGSLYTQGMVGGTAKKINDAFFRYNLMEQFNQSMRVGATEAAVGFITKHADGKASQHSARWIAELGLRQGDVKVVNGQLATTVAEGLTAEQAMRVKMAVNTWVDGAVLRPDAADKPTWMNDPKWMLISHLKQFVYAFHHTILKRVIHEVRNQNYAPAIALSGYVPIMIAADMLKGLIQGGGSEPEWKRAWGPTEYLESGVERAGLFGVGQFGVDALQGDFGSLSGPTLGQFAEGFEVLDGVKQFKPFAIHSLPANQLYAGVLRAGEADPKFVE